MTQGIKIPKIFLEKANPMEQLPLLSFSQRIFPPRPKLWDFGNEAASGVPKERKNEDFPAEQFQDHSRVWECQPGWKNSLNPNNPTGICHFQDPNWLQIPWMQHWENPFIPPPPPHSPQSPIQPWDPQERRKPGKPGKIQLTNIGLFVGFDDFRQLEIPCNDGHLEKSRKTGMSGSERLRSFHMDGNSCFPWGKAKDSSASAHPGIPRCRRLPGSVCRGFERPRLGNRPRPCPPGVTPGFQAGIHPRSRNAHRGLGLDPA